MGLKSGSRDAGLDEAENGDDQNKTSGKRALDAVDGSNSSASNEASDERAESITESETMSTRPTMESIPYKLRRDKVNEGREQVPYFLREEIIEAEDDLQDALEELLGEHVYKSDYREASMVVAQRNPELVAEILREWGYDLDAA